MTNPTGGYSAESLLGVAAKTELNKGTGPNHFIIKLIFKNTMSDLASYQEPVETFIREKVEAPTQVAVIALNFSSSLSINLRNISQKKAQELKRQIENNGTGG